MSMPDFNMDRRAMMARVLALLGAASSTVFSASVLAATKGGKTPYLAPSILTLLSAVADTIIPRTDTPGALAAGVPKLLDAMLVSWASGARRYELTQALSHIDRISQEQHGKSFADLGADARYTLLSAHDATALSHVPDTRNLSGMAAMMAGPSIADPGYAKLRELIILLYYYSEAALTTELPYEHVPGGWTPSIKVTPETRAPGGMGMF